MTNPDQYQAEGASLSSHAENALNSLTIPEGEHITIHMVHLNHLDLTWYWQLPDTIEMCLETIRWNVELLEKHPDARYSHTQVFSLKIVEDLDPELFARFTSLVKEGRVEIDSGQWVEPDHNLPSGESLARQFLYGQQYIESRFGTRSKTLINSDSFGHARSLPQILKQAGIRHMLFKRPRQRFVDLPEHPFLWQGIDGTTIPACRFINKGAGLPSLSQYYELPEGVSDLQEKVNRNLAVGITHFFASHVASDAGGVTPYLPPCEGKSYSLKYDLPTGFFESVLAQNPNLPVLDSLLNYVYEGCYTTHIDQKEGCRRAEAELRAIELLWTHASLLGSDYPFEQISDCWQRLCYLQFHDILPGTGSPEASADSVSHYHELFLQANMLRRRAQICLDKLCPNNGALRSFLVANPRPFEASGIASVDAELPISREANNGICIPDTGLLSDADGKTYPYQIVSRRSRQRFHRGEMLFITPNLPSLGIKAFQLVDGEPTSTAVSASGSILENEHLRVEVGGEGIIRSIVKKSDGRSTLRKVDVPVRIELWPETEYLGDYGSPMKAWFIGTTEERENAVPVGDPVIVENGPVRATIRTEHRWGGSTFKTDVSLYAGQDWVEMRFEIDWQEKEVLARLCVEPSVEGDLRRTYGIPFGTEMATGDELEVPAIGWADISGENAGMALLDRDRPGRTFKDDCLRVSLVRCATGDYDPCTDKDTIRASIRLLPHNGKPEGANIPLRSDEFSHPFTAWQSDPSSETPKPHSCLLEIDRPGVIISAIKAAEGREGYIVRLYESLGIQTTARRKLSSALSGCRCFESNLLEDEISPIALVDSLIKLEFHPYEIKTILLKTYELLSM